MITMNCKSILGVLLGTATLAISLQSLVLANADFGDGGDGGDSAARFLSSDQDLVGTLPAIYPGDPGDPPSGGFGLGEGKRADSMKPSFVLVGTMREVRESVIDAYGDGYVSIEETELTQANGIYEFCFHGDVTVAVDREAIEYERLTTHLRVGFDYVGGAGALSGNGYKGQAFRLSSYSMDLRYGAVLKSNIADDVTVGLELANQGVQSSYLGVATYGDAAQFELLSF
jgi:hypothetical protein